MQRACAEPASSPILQEARLLLLVLPVLGSGERVFQVVVDRIGHGALARFARWHVLAAVELVLDTARPRLRVLLRRERFRERRAIDASHAYAPSGFP